MPVSEAQRKAAAKYLEKLDEIRIRMPKGRKAEIQSHAENHGQSVNSFINSAIDEKMERDATEGPQEAPGAPTGAGVVSFLPSDAFKAAREAAGEALPVFVTRAVETQAQRDSLTRKMKKAPDKKSEA